MHIKCIENQLEWLNLRVESSSKWGWLWAKIVNTSSWFMVGCFWAGVGGIFFFNPGHLCKGIFHAMNSIKHNREGTYSVSVAVNLQLVLNLPGINTCSKRGVRKGQHQVLCGNFSSSLVKKRRMSTEVWHRREMSSQWGERVWGRSCHAKNLCQ